VAADSGLEERDEIMAEVRNSKRADAFPFATENPSGVPGTTMIADDVVAAIAGHAAENVEGVSRLGAGGVVRALTNAVSDRSAKKGRGINVETGQVEAILDLDVVVKYGTPIPEIVRNVRAAVAVDLKRLVGLVAKEINVSVEHIEFPARATSGRVK
jgi:uncharacterized alkaline shock family protein YloU